MNVHTVSIRPKVVTSETVYLRKFVTVEGTNVEKVLLALPHWA